MSHSIFNFIICYNYIFHIRIFYNKDVVISTLYSGGRRPPNSLQPKPIQNLLSFFYPAIFSVCILFFYHIFLHVIRVTFFSVSHNFSFAIRAIFIVYTFFIVGESNLVSL
jgi:hypothetical protein